MTTESKMDVGILEKIGDAFTAFSERTMGFLTRLMGSSNERTIRNLGLVRTRDLEKPYRQLEEFAKANRIEVINPTDAFREIHRADDPLYLAHDKHFSPKGHQVFATELYRYLVQDDSYIASPALSSEEQSSGG